MKKILLFSILMMFTQLFADIDWQKDLSSAFAKAAKEHKVVMVMVEGEHCKWCKKMRYRTLGDEGVEKKLSNYVTVRVMEEDEKAVKTLPEIDGVPTIFFMNADKEVIQKLVGYYDVDDFLSFITTVEEKRAAQK
ncbi:thioredoxin family protein [Sulfurovum sp. NBC37-1]|uniref:thioredoxin family protein n=1 Tax=Sulfurovum sp. (strain NBC37-1) TaxID=387093 RepID=UPI00015874B6|nr:thioredoxin family protein [Sulfurovum sp. NBC37-1]BAF71450.1 conserved hypothetical protein [Sulfurovum sp. NBC37-1]